MSAPSQPNQSVVALYLLTVFPPLASIWAQLFLKQVLTTPFSFPLLESLVEASIKSEQSNKHAGIALLLNYQGGRTQ